MNKLVIIEFKNLTGFIPLKEIQRKKLKSSRMSRRKRELVAAREQSKMEELVLFQVFFGI